MSSDDRRVLSQDEVFELLSSSRRRFLLSYLEEEHEETLVDIAVAMAAAEEGIDPEDVDREARKRTYVSLYQTHVPRLDEADVIDYDPDTGNVTLTPAADEMLPYLESGVPSDDRWPYVYLALGIAGAIGYALASIGAVPGGAATVLGTVVVVIVLASATQLRQRYAGR